MVAQGGLIAAPHGAISSQSIVLGHPAPVAAAPAYGYGGLGYGGLGYGGLGYGLGLGQYFSLLFKYTICLKIKFR